MRTIALFLLLGCASYQFQTSVNPFAYYDIHSIAIPNMVSYATISGLSSLITREIKLLLSNYPELTVYSGEHAADAILIGFITSSDTLDETFVVRERQYEEQFGLRKFYIPTLLSYDIGLRLVLIKNHKINGARQNGEPVILFDRFMTFTKIVERVTDNNDFNFTQNKKIMEKSTQELVLEMTSYFREVILNAF